jgi:hypothetical protein
MEVLFDSYSLPAFGLDADIELFDNRLGDSSDGKSPENFVTQHNANGTKIL